MWNEETDVSDQKIEQVWFAGMHSNVGGGYKKDEMAYVALDWMMQKAEGLKGDDGIKFLPYLREEAATQANPYGKIYDSRSGFSTTYRYKSRDVKEICEKAHCQTLIHESVLKRIKHNTEGYAPVTIPVAYSNISNYTDSIDKEPKKRTSVQELAKKDIWWRRITYFLLVVTTVSLLFVVLRHSKMPLPDQKGQRVLLINSLVHFQNFFLTLLVKG